MAESLDESEERFLKRYVPVAAFIGGLCCFTPVAVVLLGVASVSYAASLTDVLYYEYAWAFRLAGLVFLLGALGAHLYTHEKVCTLDAAVRKRRTILNLLFLSVTFAVLTYVVWLYVIVEIVGLILGIW